jgi:hypothetical protein
MVIPELFWRDRSGSEYAKAHDINARPVHAYLASNGIALRAGELDGVWSALEASWARFNADKPKDRPEVAVDFIRLALESCRFLNAVLMMEDWERWY